MKDTALYEELFAIRPRILAHDLHPDYATTHYAVQRAAQEGIELRAVQHHHAHLASCMAEHGLREPVIGVTFDGTGYGTGCPPNCGDGDEKPFMREGIFTP